jgi:hypothetical protein
MKINIPARLIHGYRIEAKPHESTLGRGMKKTIAPGIIGDNGAIGGVPQVIAP